MHTPHLWRPRGRSRRRFGALLAIPALVAPMLLTTGTGPASAEPIDTDIDAAAVLPSAGVEPVAVTLITGDTVYWQDNSNGNPRVAEIEQAPRDYPVTFDQSGTQEDFYVIPTDVMEHVVAGTVDEELFNIPGLIRQGLDDATTDELPVIVTFDQDRSSQQLKRDASALPAAGHATAVKRVNGAGITIDRGNAGRFRDAVLGRPGTGRGASTSAQSLDGQVEKVLLDRVLEIDLDKSVPRIGAPQVWDAGYTGEGVTVAVLDTGVDASHPDLAGQVVAEANFTDEPDAVDHHGHGTHVASTVAGTGAASGGQYVGVAPDADLVSGKVCNSNGQCQTSWIMAGMEWATKQHGADVVNMSLGGDPTGGTDILSQLVDDLSVQTGALFVISAGNSGPGRGRVGSPAAADAALAVGAVDKSDQMASFSSRGPRIGDHTVKPEITAPGVGIVAARADGTTLGEPVDQHYTSLNGTSMSSPHLAGAAALLAQARGLTGQELKDALVSTAADTGHRWYEQGTGRVDVPAAVDSPVYAQGTVNIGGVDGQATQDFTYTNNSDQDVTLTLDVSVTDHAGQPVDGVSLSAGNLLVPAGGQASATLSVTADLTGQEQAVFGGVITATAADVSLRTAVGFGPPLQRVNIEVLDFNGRRIGTETAGENFVWLVHDTFDPEAGGNSLYQLRTSGGAVTAHVPAGIYTVMSRVTETEPGAGTLPPPLREALLVEVEISINTDTILTLDARDAVQLEVSVPRKAEKRNHAPGIVRELSTTGGPGWLTVPIGGSRNPTYVTPAPAARLAALWLVVSWTLAEPKPWQPVFESPLCPGFPFFCFSETPSYVYNLLFLYENGIPKNLHERVKHRDLVAVPTRFHSEYSDALIQHQFDALVPHTSQQVAGGSAVRLWFKPGKVTEYFLADDRVSWHRRADIVRRPEGQGTFRANLVSSDWFPAAEAGARRDEERWFEAPWRMGVADFREEHLTNPIDELMFAAGVRGGTDNHLFVPGFYAMDNTRGHMAIAIGHASWRMWNRDTGVELEPAGLAFPVSSEGGQLRLEQVEAYSAGVAGVFRTGRATTTWTFTSRPSSAKVPEGYRCPLNQPPVQDVCQIQPLIQLEYDLGLDIHNRVAAGRAHRFTVFAGHHSKAIDRSPVTSMTVQVSVDGGRTWYDSRVVGMPKDNWDTGGFLHSATPYQEFRVVLMLPPLHRTDGFVTLRVQATDANGGSVEQTIDRAYILK